jgi:hypothetical protein
MNGPSTPPLIVKSCRDKSNGHKDVCQTYANRATVSRTMGMGVGLSDHENGRIITLVATTPSYSMRLRPPVRRILERLSQERGKSPKEIVELAIGHLDGTLRNGQPVYMDIPPDEPKSHKRARRVA